VVPLIQIGTVIQVRDTEIMLTFIQSKITSSYLKKKSCPILDSFSFYKVLNILP